MCVCVCVCAHARINFVHIICMTLYKSPSIYQTPMEQCPLQKKIRLGSDYSQGDTNNYTSPECIHPLEYSGQTYQKHRKKGNKLVMISLVPRPFPLCLLVQGRPGNYATFTL